ncbi:MAG: phosphorylase family protein, partial [Tumebacillaceae bacterium]
MEAFSAGHGKTQFGIQTQFLINHYQQLDSVICAGCAGGLAEKIAIFDVVAAEKTIEHDYRLKFARRPDPEFQGDHRFLERLRKIQVNSFKIHFGAIASGDEDIADPVRAEELRQQTGAIAV